MSAHTTLAAYVLLCLTAVQRFASADTAIAPLAGAAFEPTASFQPPSTDSAGAPLPATPDAPTGVTPTKPPDSGTPTVAPPLAPAFNADAVCAPFPDIISAGTDPVADFPCDIPANFRESACTQYPGCVWITARMLCSGAFDPDACSRFTVAECTSSPFCTGVDNAQAAAADFANGVPPPIRPPAPPDGGGTAGPNAEPPDPFDYDYGSDYRFTSDGTAGGGGVPPGGSGGGVGGGGGGGGGGQGGSPAGNGRGRLPEFGTSGTISSSGAVLVTAIGDDEAEAPLELPEPGSLLDAAPLSVSTGAAALVSLCCVLGAVVLW